MFCENCGEQITDGKKFCSRCGRPVQDGSISPLVYNHSYDSPGRREAQKKNKKGIVIIILLLLLIVLLVGIIMYISMDFSQQKEGEAVAATGNESNTDIISGKAEDEKVDKVVQSIEETDKTETVCVRTLKVETDQNLKYEYKFDARGYETTRMVCNYDDGQPVSRREREYDQQGREIKTTMYNADNTVSWVQEYTYGQESARKSDSKDNYDEEYYSREGIVSDVRHNVSGDLLSEREYDAYGNKIKEISYKEDGSVKWIHEIVYEYDSVGNIIKEMRYDTKGNLYFWQEREYHADGRETKRINYNMDGSVAWWFEYQYDQHKNRTEMTQYNAEGIAQETYAPWNGKDDTEYPDKHIIYEYDNTGNITNRMLLDAKGIIICWTEYEVISVTDRD